MDNKQTSDQEEFKRLVSKKELRKLKAKRRGKLTVWQGFSVFGLIGWSVAVPAVMFTLFGVWLDNKYPGGRSYTLALLVAGIALGCFNAWFWVQRKMKELQEEEPEKLPEN